MPRRVPGLRQNAAGAAHRLDSCRVTPRAIGRAGNTPRERRSAVDHLVSCGDGRAMLVANRGEIAVRIFATCRRLGIRTAAAVGPGDHGALHTRVADTAVDVPSYLDAGALVAAAREAGAELVHPGYGFLAESAAFAEAVAAAGLTWIGPLARCAPPRRGQARGEADRCGRRRTDAHRRRAGRGRAPAPREGGGGRRRPRDARGRAGRGPRGGPRGGLAGGGSRVRGRHRVLRALPDAAAPRRGAADRRPPRDGARPRRARLLGAAPPPEGRRGVSRHPASPETVRAAARGPRRRLRRARSATRARGRPSSWSRTTSRSSWS